MNAFAIDRNKSTDSSRIIDMAHPKVGHNDVLVQRIREISGISA